MAKFIVHVSRGVRWTIESEDNDKAAAIKHARMVLGRNQVDGVKVTDAAGKVLFQEEHRTKAMTVVPVAEAPPCAALEDYYKFPARKTIGRLMRKFLDEQLITALELVYGYGYLRMVARADTLCHQAVSGIGNLQARAAGDNNVQSRIDALYEAFDKVTQRAKKVGEAEEYLAVVQNRGVEGLVQSLANEPPVRRDFFVRAGISAHIATNREWSGKLALMLNEVDKNPGSATMAFIDEVIAEILDGSEAIRDCLGPQSDLASALIVLVKVVRGQYAPKAGGSDLLPRLNRVLARPDLTLSRGIVLEQIKRRLSGTAALTRGGQGEEGKAFGVLLNGLAGENGLIGGPDMAMSVLSRAKLVLGGGSGLTMGQAISRSVVLFNGKAARIGFLADVCETRLVEDEAEALLENLTRLVKGCGSAADLVADMNPAPNGKSAAGALAGRLAAAALPDGAGQGFAQRLQAL